MVKFLELNPLTGLPRRSTLPDLLGIDATSPTLYRLVEDSLFAPAHELMQRPSKRFRAELVSLGYILGKDSTSTAKLDERTFSLCSQAVELLHAGSLIVDDIQDGSRERRGGPALHERYGVAGALCAGNWLYFWPLRLIREARLSADQEHRIFALYCDAVERAHYGQALDLSVRVDTLPQNEVAAAVRGVIGLKTGSITALAIGLGALLAEADETRESALTAFGHDFGVALQELDDLGNLIGKKDPAKRREDLKQRKLSAVWSYASEMCDATTYKAFAGAVEMLRLGDESKLDDWLASVRFVARATEKVREKLAGTLQQAMQLPGFGPEHPATEKLRRLEKELVHAYC